MLVRDLKICVYDKSTNRFFYKNVTKGSIGNLENNRNKPNLDLVLALSEYYDVSTD
ncbi:helix-turn-helix domain-containing protein [Paenibacillus terrae]|uniref:helix-turn-helix domain-containing protein n=1 Tax=Paenibacillus terrae TaxID=159743 RepID=UPI000B329A3F